MFWNDPPCSPDLFLAFFLSFSALHYHLFEPLDAALKGYRFVVEGEEEKEEEEVEEEDAWFLALPETLKR